MPNLRLTESRVEALKPRRSPYDVRDTELKGFGVRVLPSGSKRYFVHSQHEGRRTWKTVGDAGSVDLEEACRRATDLLAAIRRDESPALDEGRLFEDVAEEVFDRYRRNWKPGTCKVNRNYLRSTILPRFRGRNIADITRQEVQGWVVSLRAKPVAADRSVPILSVIMRQAELYGYRPVGSNPCTGIRRYRRKGRERFLSGQELRRLGTVLASHEAGYPRHVAFIRLLLLTGCRKAEIVTLQWSDYREGHLFLPDSKTGPRTVWLSSPARDTVNGLPRRGRWIFPSPLRPAPMSVMVFENFWYRIREEAEIADVRLHDLRHTFASIAIMQGETVTTIARLLGHNDVRTTLKYTHLADRSVREAVDALAAILGQGTQLHPVDASNGKCSG